jgi:hypothetical protein
MAAQGQFLKSFEQYLSIWRLSAAPLAKWDFIEEPGIIPSQVIVHCRGLSDR